MEMEQFLEIVLSQTPSMALLGFAVYWLAKNLEKEKTSKEELSKRVIEMTFLWEKKYSDESETHKEVRSLLYDIRKHLDRQNGNLKDN